MQASNFGNAEGEDQPPGGHPAPAISLYSTINKERKLMRKGGDWKPEQEQFWMEFDVGFKQVISGKAKKKKVKVFQLLYVSLPLPFLISALEKPACGLL